jgi:hypothetical protein
LEGFSHVLLDKEALTCILGDFLQALDLFLLSSFLFGACVIMHLLGFYKFELEILTSQCNVIVIDIKLKK